MKLFRASVLMLLTAGVVLVSVDFVAADEEERTAAPEQTATRPATLEEAFGLPEIIVTATRAEVEAFAAPYTTNVVPLSGFSRQRLYRTTTGALEDVPGVMVQKTANAQGSPYLRGFTGFRTLMMVDGIRLNNSVFRDGPNQYWNLVDPYTIRRLEVVKGPSSVLYGSDAVGGTVNAILRRPDGYDEGLNSYRRFSARVSTAEGSFIGRGEVVATYGNEFGTIVGGTWKHFGNVDGGDGVGRQPRTGYGQCSGDARIEFHPDPDTTWTLAHYQLYEDDAWRTHKTIYGIAWQGATVGNELKRVIDESRTLTYVRYARRNTGAFIDAFELTGSVQSLSEERWRTKSSGSGDRQGVDVITYGVTGQFETPSPIGRWTYGVEWYHDEVESFKGKYSAPGVFASSEIQGPVGDDASYDLLGVYVQDAIPLAERLEVMIGGRWTYARADADKVEDPDTGLEISVEDDWCALVGSARVSWLVDPEEHWNLYGGVSQGFRAPNLSDLTRLDTARSNEIETPSPGLDPERFISYEAGVKASYDDLSLQAAWFFTDVADMIVRAPTGNVIGGDNEVTKKNAGDGHLCGAEIGARWRFDPQWTAFGSFAYVYGEVDTFPTSAPVTRSEPVSRLMPPTGQFGVRFDPDRRFWVEGVCTAACKADHLSTRDAGDTQRIPPGGTPGYFTVDLRGGWRVQDGLELWAAIENLTNEGYRIHGSGVNEPGVNFLFGVQWRF